MQSKKREHDGVECLNSF